MYFIHKCNNQSFKKQNDKILNKTIDNIQNKFDCLDLTDEINHLLLIFKHIFPSESLNQATITEKNDYQLNLFQDDDLLNDNFMDTLNELLESTQNTDITSHLNNTEANLVNNYCESSQSSFCSIPSSQSYTPQFTSTQQTTTLSDDPFEGLNALSTTTSNSSIEIVKMTNEEKIQYHKKNGLIVDNNENKQITVKSERKRRLSNVDPNEDDNKTNGDDDDSLWWEKGKKPRVAKRTQTQLKTDKKSLIKEKGALLKEALIKETSKSLLLSNSLLKNTPSNSPKTKQIPSGYKDLVLNVLKKKQLT